MERGSVDAGDGGSGFGVSDRTFRRYIDRYEEDGIAGVSDKRLRQASFRRAPVDEVMAVTDLYNRGHRGWNVKHFTGGIAEMGVGAVTLE